MYKHTPFLRNTSAALLALLVAGCSGGGTGSTGRTGSFIVLRSIPANNGQLFLNQSIAFEFTNKVDQTSADFNSVSFAVFDLNGKQLSEPVEGNFRVSTATGDSEPGRRLEFVPKFPITDTFTDGGFAPGRKYIVNLVRGDHRRNVGLIDASGRGLESAFSFAFQTADGTTPSQLFRDTKVGGPRRSGFDVSPRNPATAEIELSELGQVQTEIRLEFDQPLNPHSSNVPSRVDLDPRTRSINNRGRIFLEYDDLKGAATWIPSVVSLEVNSLEGSTVVLRPLGVLPNNASIRVIVESTMEDMSGESNVNDAAYNRIFASFETDSSYELRFDALVENFLNTENIDFEAPFVEPLAEIKAGIVRANFDFEGGRTNLDYEPNTREVVLDTDFTQITPKNGQPINVSNGIFTFRNVTIPRGVTVRGTGSNPMVWLVTGNFTVEGDLQVDGGPGQRVDTLNSANFPSGGGTGNCNGGRGGQGSPNSTDRSFLGENGYGAGEVPNGGGAGGRINCANNGCGIGSGGGGGTFVTQGDPYYKIKGSPTFVQPSGQGAYGCNQRSSTALPGGKAGPLVFTDPFVDNNFWGSAVDLNRGIRISGEMRKPHGGQGGGGGGDYSLSCASRDPNFFNDEKAGGGAAGGGVLIIKALGKVIVKKSGHISANGGNGGGGAWAGSSNRAGGGGAGSGGMVIIMAGENIDIDVHGETYARGNYDFAITADGGIGLLDTYGGGGNVRGKYPPSSAGNMNARPSGAMGGLGIIQLMAPPGPNSTPDGTNTILDDNIIIRDAGNIKTGADKQRFIAWRGTPDASGIFRDDGGNEVKLGDAEGDMRPSPMLLPAPFGTRSRVRSKWIDLGSVARRMTVAGGDGNPRGVVVQPKLNIGDDFGPLPEFEGVENGPSTDAQPGYVRVIDDNVGGVKIDFQTILKNQTVNAVKTNVSYRGQEVYEVTLPASGNSTLGAEHNRYSHYSAVLTDGASSLGEFRILGHTGVTLYLSTESGSLANINGTTRSIKLAIVEKFFSIFTNSVEGFPQSFVGRSGTKYPSVRIPRANVRIRFAFHQNPKSTQALRYPPIQTGKPLQYFSDWSDPAKLEMIRKGGYKYVMYDILFNTQYEWDPAFPNTNSLSPDTPRPEIRRLVLPYRY